MPSRCRKDIVKAIQLDSEGRVGIRGLETLIHNISPKPTSSLSRQEIETLIIEVNPQKRTIGVDEMLKLL